MRFTLLQGLDSYYFTRSIRAWHASSTEYKKVEMERCSIKLWCVSFTTLKYINTHTHLFFHFLLQAQEKQRMKGVSSDSKVLHISLVSAQLYCVLFLDDRVRNAQETNFTNAECVFFLLFGKDERSL